MIKIATIAGSDASGGAGLEADLKTFEEYGLYGMTAVTVIATMDPDNNWAHGVFPIDEQTLKAQLETIFKGVGVSAAKSGMLGTFHAVELTREYISAYSIKNYVLDPVMICKGNDEALNPELNQAIAEKLLPLAKVVTPNLFEAAQLSGMEEIASVERMKEAAKIIAGRGAANVFIKGGSKLPNPTEALDLLYDGTHFELIKRPFIKTTWTHGAGCTVAAAITSGLARGLSVYDAIVLAKKFISQNLEGSFPLNSWVGPGNPTNWRKNTLFT
ncbi:MAG: bifunctional hydroxymethylpyrimidine kinase/phosphomethylpyrimidine kinase [Spirochaetaceae bacterium]|jgi:pyridoxine kinase|nr:bifunctional hydroxymethylpyrimidine kinase/phosphomethylpyrimidine kinase [Spirochaetaceae bacterium]